MIHLQTSTSAQPLPMAYQFEKVGVSKIKIRQARAQATAVLGTFVAADKLLRAWAHCSPDYFECEFEIVYLDGFQVSGLYPMWQKCTTRQSLGAYVRREAEHLQGSAAYADFLDSYETEDFAVSDAA